MTRIWEKFSELICVLKRIRIKKSLIFLFALSMEVDEYLIRVVGIPL